MWWQAVRRRPQLLLLLLVATLLPHRAVTNGQEGGADSFQSECPGQMGVDARRLHTQFLRHDIANAGFERPDLQPAPDGTAIISGVIPTTVCRAVAELAAPMLDPAAQRRDSVDGSPEFQLDVLDPDDPTTNQVSETCPAIMLLHIACAPSVGKGAELTHTGMLQHARADILHLLWPPIVRNLLPLLHETTQPDGPFPLDGWPTSTLPSSADLTASMAPTLRISDMFIRRYDRPPRGASRRNYALLPT